MRRTGATLIPYLICAAGATAQVLPGKLVEVRGTIADERGPIAGAEVRLSREESDQNLIAITNQDGAFEFRSVQVGTWMLWVRRIGYKVHTEVVRADLGVTDLGRIMITALPQPLDTVSVVKDGATPTRYGPSSRMDEFYRRRARARGRFFTREDIEASRRAKLTDLLRVVPGARVRTYPGNLAEVHFARCSGPVRLSRSGNMSAVASGNSGGASPSVALYVNGVRVDTASLRQTLGELDLGELEAIEVYRGVSELPPEAVGDACAAIFVWTRFGPGS